MTLAGGHQSHDHPLHHQGLDGTLLLSASYRRRDTVALETAHGPTGLNHDTTLGPLVQIRGIERRRREVTGGPEIGLAALIRVSPLEA